MNKTKKSDPSAMEPLRESVEDPDELPEEHSIISSETSAKVSRRTSSASPSVASLTEYDFDDVDDDDEDTEEHTEDASSDRPRCIHTDIGLRDMAASLKSQLPSATISSLQQLLYSAQATKSALLDLRAGSSLRHVQDAEQEDWEQQLAALYDRQAGARLAACDADLAYFRALLAEVVSVKFEGHLNTSEDAFEDELCRLQDEIGDTRASILVLRLRATTIWAKYFDRLQFEQRPIKAQDWGYSDGLIRRHRPPRSRVVIGNRTHRDVKAKLAYGQDTRLPPSLTMHLFGRNAPEHFLGLPAGIRRRNRYDEQGFLSLEYMTGGRQMGGCGSVDLRYRHFEELVELFRRSRFDGPDSRGWRDRMDELREKEHWGLPARWMRTSTMVKMAATIGLISDFGKYFDAGGIEDLEGLLQPGRRLQNESLDVNIVEEHLFPSQNVHVDVFDIEPLDFSCTNIVAEMQFRWGFR
ncbi:uncharacterized protein BKA78DRAFT_377785 [Phyllosticta capitalensis]|uniref:Uncharacterized protein n=1 Tax=Phyllosticta capitalensis TaxID=121624 RepID=A0ABR1YV77_9PEZI